MLMKKNVWSCLPNTNCGDNWDCIKWDGFSLTHGICGDNWDCIKWDDRYLSI